MLATISKLVAVWTLVNALIILFHLICSSMKLAKLASFPDNSTDEQPGLIANDLVTLITPKLSDRQKEILALLLDGCGVREAGRKLGISHPAVIKHRKRIARIASEVIGDIAPTGLLSRSILDNSSTCVESRAC